MSFPHNRGQHIIVKYAQVKGYSIYSKINGTIKLIILPGIKKMWVWSKTIRIYKEYTTYIRMISSR